MYFENTLFLLCQKQKYLFFKILVYSLNTNNILNNAVDN